MIFRELTYDDDLTGNRHFWKAGHEPKPPRKGEVAPGKNYWLPEIQVEENSALTRRKTCERRVSLDDLRGVVVVTNLTRDMTPDEILAADERDVEEMLESPQMNAIVQTLKDLLQITSNTHTTDEQAHRWVVNRLAKNINSNGANNE